MARQSRLDNGLKILLLNYPAVIVYGLKTFESVVCAWQVKCQNPTSAAATIIRRRKVSA